MTDIVIYHNPECGTSRNALAMIRNAGIEPHVVEYLKTPPSRSLLENLIERAGISPRALLREKGTPFAELGLDNPALTDSQLIDAVMEHPILINRPLVVSPSGETTSAAPSPRKTANRSSTPPATASRVEGETP